MYLKPMVIVGHSGSGLQALFNSLEQLQIQDEIILHYLGKETRYQVTLMYEKEKEDSLVLESDLILVTCQKNSKTKRNYKQCNNRSYF